VRDRDATRYHITPRDAVYLIDQALEGNTAGLIPSNLVAYSIGDLADVFGQLTNRQPIYTSLLDGEKRHETLDGITNSGEAKRIPRDELKRLVSNYLKLTLQEQKRKLFWKP
jgi:FlaA1/EpsC-like NDP-sugar epimerase